MSNVSGSKKGKYVIREIESREKLKKSSKRRSPISSLFYRDLRKSCRPFSSCTRGPNNNGILELSPAKRSCSVWPNRQAVPLEEDDLLENTFEEDASDDVNFDDSDSSFISSVLPV